MSNCQNLSNITNNKISFSLRLRVLVKQTIDNCLPLLLWTGIPFLMLAFRHRALIDIYWCWAWRIMFEINLCQRGLWQNKQTIMTIVTHQGHISKSQNIQPGIDWTCVQKLSELNRLCLAIMKFCHVLAPNMVSAWQMKKAIRCLVRTLIHQLLAGRSLLCWNFCTNQT